MIIIISTAVVGFGVVVYRVWLMMLLLYVVVLMIL